MGFDHTFVSLIVHLFKESRNSLEVHFPSNIPKRGEVTTTGWVSSLWLAALTVIF
jgi:hypothetical protein